MKKKIFSRIATSWPLPYFCLVTAELTTGLQSHCGEVASDCTGRKQLKGHLRFLPRPSQMVLEHLASKWPRVSCRGDTVTCL